MMALKAFNTLATRPQQQRSSFAKTKNLLGTIQPENGTKSGTNGTNGYHLQTPLQAQFRSSSSQTTFLDRNIVQNLAVTASAPLTASSSKLSSIGGLTSTTTTACGTMTGHPLVPGPNHQPIQQQANVGTTCVPSGTNNGAPPGARRRRPRTVPASYTSTSGGSGKRASFSGTLPDGE